MARRKAKEENEVIETSELIDVEQATEAKTVGTQEPSDSEKTDEIPERVKKVLKIFSNHAELLIASDGRVYTPGCKLAIAKGAIHYKNPYYNS